MKPERPGERDLQAQQAALLEALWAPSPQAAVAGLERHVATAPPSGASWVRGLRAYRSNAVELSVRALQGAYPALARMLGDEDFRGLARAHWAQCPPALGDVARWGAELSAHLKLIPELLAEAPWSPDLACLEWALHEAHTAADVVPDLASLAMLADSEPAAIELVFDAGFCVVESDFPVVSLARAALAGEGTPSTNRGESAVIWRRGMRPDFRTAMKGEVDFLKKLKEPGSLADALNSAPGLDFGSWLNRVVQDGLLLGARRLA